MVKAALTLACAWMQHWGKAGLQHGHHWQGCQHRDRPFRQAACCAVSAWVIGSAIGPSDQMGDACKADETALGQGICIGPMGNLNAVPPHAGLMQASVNLAVQRRSMHLCPSGFERGIGGGAAIAAWPVTCGQRHGFVQKEQGRPAPFGLWALIASFGVFQRATDPMRMLPARDAKLATPVKAQDPTIARQHPTRPISDDLARWLHAVLKGGRPQIINSFVALSLTSG